MQSISIIGAGWLGTSLAHALKNQGHEVRITKRQQEDVNQFKAQGFIAASYILGNPLPQAIGHTDVAVVNIPPNRKTIKPEFFTKSVKALCDALIASGTQRLIFISTTSVFGEQDGTVTESTPASPITDSGKAHSEIESYLRSTYPNRVSILRLSGLVGGERHPVKFLSGRKDIGQPHQPVNLVHRDDVIAIITAIIQKQAWGQHFLLSATSHPSRKDYYSWAAKSLGLALPEFKDEAEPSSPKVIDCQNTLKQLGVQLQYPSPYDMVPLV